MSASKYSYVAGFDGTSNVLCGKLFGIPVKGTHAHSFVMSYTSLDDLKEKNVQKNNSSEKIDLLSLSLEKLKLLGFAGHTNNGELAAFIGYGLACPHIFLALVDTYDTLSSGVANFLAVGWALYEAGYKPMGIRLDSGNLAKLSKDARQMFIETDKKIGISIFSNCSIVASNDINEATLLALNEQGHEINSFGIGTNLVTCQRTPALGCVYKLVEINGKKLSLNSLKYTHEGIA